MELLDLFMPRECCICSTRLLPCERHLCYRCAGELPLTYFEARSRNPMADRINALLCKEEVAGNPAPDCGNARLCEEEVASNPAPDCGNARLCEEEVACNPAPDCGNARLCKEEVAGNPAPDRGNALLCGEEQHLSSADELPLPPREPRPHTPYIFATALFFYAGRYRKITRLIKYYRHFELGEYFGKLLGERIQKAPHLSDIDAVIPMPLHWTRRLKRGYNQAEIIARSLAAVLGVPCLTAVLRRSRRTRTQVEMHGEERLRNVSGAFTLHRCAQQSPATHTRHILLVDDVMTTGATLLAAYYALREGLGDEIRISVATLAYVPHDN